jgi:hypothetical protein
MILWRRRRKVWRDGHSVTTRRPPGFDLRLAIREAGFTPRASDLPALVDLLDGEDAEAAERALVRLGPAAADRLAAALDAARPPRRARLARALGKLALEERALIPRVLALLDDADAKTSRNAILALGHLPSPAVEARLRELLHAAPTPAHRRSAAEALGKIGGAASLAALADLDARGDAELPRIAGRAVLRLRRTLGRDAPSEIDLDARPERPIAVELSCRPGLEELLAEEVGGRARGPGRVAATLAGSLAELHRARLFLDVTFPVRAGRDAASAITSDAALGILRRFTRGAIRYRLAFATGGHRRAEVLRVAAAVSAVRPELENDPTASTWEIVAGEGGRITLAPRRFTDPRFSYRVRDVPAASHPTVAAALARVAGARADDVVWDPFVGSGVELVERARLGPYRSLHGTDLDPRALEAARENLAAAGVRATLERRDARGGAPPGTTLVLTNPPMGHRVLDRDAIPALLSELVALAGRALPPGGRLVWLSPVPRVTADAARRAGLRIARHHPVDLGGLRAELQALVR